MTLTTATPSEGAVPRARRSHRARWRNPRLLVGLVLVAGSVVLGARLFASADDTVGVWSVARDLPVGAVVEKADLEPRQVRFSEPETAAGYLAVGTDPPNGGILARPVSAGELLPHSAFAENAVEDLVEVPVSVLADDLPATVRQGSVVDIWVTPKLAGPGEGKLKATAVLTDVVVVSVPTSSEGLAPQATRQVIVGVPTGRTAALATALGGISDGRVVVVRKGAG